VLLKLSRDCQKNLFEWLDSFKLWIYGASLDNGVGDISDPVDIDSGDHIGTHLQSDSNNSVPGGHPSTR
jgi:hypothetical protein